MSKLDYNMCRLQEGEGKMAEIKSVNYGEIGGRGIINKGIILILLRQDSTFTSCPDPYKYEVAI